MSERRSLLRPACLALAAAALVLACGAARADTYLQGVGVDHALSFSHDRFYTGIDKAFIGQPYDWSGVGHASSGTWATMISPHYFLSANHYHPGAGDTLTFYTGNSTGGPSFAYTVDTFGYQATYGAFGSDLYLGRITAALDASIAKYPVLDLPSDAAYLGLELWTYGVPYRVGKNNVDSIEDLNLSGKTRLMVFGYNATGGQGSDEAYIMTGDSGGPSFAVVDGSLALLGTHFVNGGPVPFDGAQSGDSFIPFYIDQLNAHMSDGESVLTVVPEPGTVVLLFASGAVLWLARAVRRTRRAA